jgi:hypothetical protein
MLTQILQCDEVRVFSSFRGFQDANPKLRVIREIARNSTHETTMEFAS